MGRVIGGEVFIHQDEASLYWVASDDEGRLLAQGRTRDEMLAELADLDA